MDNKNIRRREGMKESIKMSRHSTDSSTSKSLENERMISFFHLFLPFSFSFFPCNLVMVQLTDVSAMIASLYDL
jgi:hypothetical protein